MKSGSRVAPGLCWARKNEPRQWLGGQIWRYWFLAELADPPSFSPIDYCWLKLEKRLYFFFLFFLSKSFEPLHKKKINKAGNNSVFKGKANKTHRFFSFFFFLAKVQLLFLLLTFVVCLQIIQIKVCLPVAQDEGQERQDEGVQDAHDGQHIGPAYRAVAQWVFPRLLAAHVPDHLGVPPVGKDHAAQHQAHSCRRPEQRNGVEVTPVGSIVRRNKPARCCCYAFFNTFWRKGGVLYVLLNVYNWNNIGFCVSKNF